MCVYQNVNAPNHALLEVRNHEDGTFELVALNTTYGSSQAGNATVTVKVVALERDVDVWITELWHKLPIATEVLTHLLTNCFLVMKGLSIFLIPLEVCNIFEQAFDFGLLVFFVEALISLDLDTLWQGGSFRDISLTDELSERLEHLRSAKEYIFDVLVGNFFKRFRPG